MDYVDFYRQIFKSMNSKGSILLLGMVFSEEFEPKRGQEYRDRVRCEAVEKLGYQVKTLDNKHEDTKIHKHCNANFSDPRRMMKTMKEKWGGEKFCNIILDYFFSPVGWARERWTDNLFAKTLPMLAISGCLAKNGKVWLPNLINIQESINEFRTILEKHYIIKTERNPKKNPLFLATESVETELLLCPDSLTNETQMRPLNAFSSEPFYVLELKDTNNIEFPIQSPTKKSKATVDIESSQKKRLRITASPK